MRLETLYKRTSLGQIQQWTIEINGDKFFSSEGIVGGKISTNQPTVCKPKNIGKANATTPEEQAVREATAKWEKKLASGYSVDINNLESDLINPMLAKSYSDYPDIVYSVYIQYKIDGIRCNVSKDGMFTRNGKQIISAPHIMEALRPMLIDNPDLILDGELYNHELKHDFNKITSLVKRTKPTEEELNESATIIQYHIYDIITGANTIFSERTRLLHDIIKENHCIKLVETTMVNNKEELDRVYEQYLANGYEGQMIRIDAPYEHKRSKNLLKRKEFITEEFEILSVIDGEGDKTGVAGSVVMKLGDTTFNANIKGDRAFLRELLNNKYRYIGNLGTIRFPNYTPAGVPRFPYLVAIRDYE